MMYPFGGGSPHHAAAAQCAGREQTPGDVVAGPCQALAPFGHHQSAPSYMMPEGVNPGFMMAMFHKTMLQTKMSQTMAQQGATRPPTDFHPPAVHNGFLEAVKGPETMSESEKNMEIRTLRQNLPCFRNRATKLCTTYRFWGAWWVHGRKITMPRKLKCLAIQWIDPTLWNGLRLSMLDELKVDALSYVLFGVHPEVEIRELNLSLKMDLWDMLLTEHGRIMSANPNRLQQMAPDLQNVLEVAISLGWPKNGFPHHNKWQRWRRQRIKHTRKH